VAVPKVIVMLDEGVKPEPVTLTTVPGRPAAGESIIPGLGGAAAQLNHRGSPPTASWKPLKKRIKGCANATISRPIRPPVIIAVDQPTMYFLYSTELGKNCARV
jgi:hypothetical protein